MIKTHRNSPKHCKTWTCAILVIHSIVASHELTIKPTKFKAWSWKWSSLQAWSGHWHLDLTRSSRCSRLPSADASGGCSSPSSWTGLVPRKNTWDFNVQRQSATSSIPRQVLLSKSWSSTVLSVDGPLIWRDWFEMFEAVTCVLWPVSIRSTLLHLATALWFAWVMRKIVFASLLQFEVSKVKRLTLLLMTLHALTLCIFKSNMISAKILCEPAKWAAFQLQLTRLKTSGCVIASIVWIFNNVLATGSSSRQ